MKTVSFVKLDRLNENWTTVKPLILAGSLRRETSEHQRETSS